MIIVYLLSLILLFIIGIVYYNTETYDYEWKQNYLTVGKLIFVITIWIIPLVNLIVLTALLFVILSDDDTRIKKDSWLNKRIL